VSDIIGGFEGSKFGGVVVGKLEEPEEPVVVTLNTASTVYNGQTFKLIATDNTCSNNTNLDSSRRVPALAACAVPAPPVFKAMPPPAVQQSINLEWNGCYSDVQKPTLSPYAPPPPYEPEQQQKYYTVLPPDTYAQNLPYPVKNEPYYYTPDHVNHTNANHNHVNHTNVNLNHVNLNHTNHINHNYVDDHINHTNHVQEYCYDSVPYVDSYNESDKEPSSEQESWSDSDACGTSSSNISKSPSWEGDYSQYPTPIVKVEESQYPFWTAEPDFLDYYDFDMTGSGTVKNTWYEPEGNFMEDVLFYVEKNF